MLYYNPVLDLLGEYHESMSRTFEVRMIFAGEGQFFFLNDNWIKIGSLK